MRVPASRMDLRQLHRTKFRVFTGEAYPRDGTILDGVLAALGIGLLLLHLVELHRQRLLAACVGEPPRRFQGV